MRNSFYILIGIVVLVAAYLYMHGTPVPHQPAAPTALAALHEADVALASGKTLHLQIPENYSITVAAQGMRSARFMAWSPDNRLFVGEMNGAGDTQTGRVLVLDNFDEAAETFGSVHTYLDNQRNPNSVAFYTDPSGTSWIYVALTDKLVRYPYHAGDAVPAAAPETIATFPDYGQDASIGGWHLTRTLAFDGGKLFVSLGSSCNSCEETSSPRAEILQMNPDGSGSRTYADGLRNAVGITYADGALFATANESDHLGNDRPNDLVYKIADGTNYGWPYCYQYQNAIYEDMTQEWQHPFDCSQVPLAWSILPPHSAPLGLAYIDTSFDDPALRDSFLVALHGSGKPGIGTGYEVDLVRQGTSTPFISGFLQDGTRTGRPVAILPKDTASFFISDDLNGAIYYVRSVR